MTQIPDAFLRQVCDFELPEPGRYAVGTAFLPTDSEAADEARVHIAKLRRRGGPPRRGLARRADAGRT